MISDAPAVVPTVAGHDDLFAAAIDTVARVLCVEALVGTHSVFDLAALVFAEDEDPRCRFEQQSLPLRWMGRDYCVCAALRTDAAAWLESRGYDADRLFALPKHGSDNWLVIVDQDFSTIRGVSGVWARIMRRDG